MSAEDPLAFEVIYLLKYFHNFKNFIYQDSKTFNQVLLFGFILLNKCW